MTSLNLLQEAATAQLTTHLLRNLLQAPPACPSRSGQPSWPAMRRRSSSCSSWRRCSARGRAAGVATARPQPPSSRAAGCSSCCRPRLWRPARSGCCSRWRPRRVWLGRRRARRGTRSSCPRRTGGRQPYPLLARVGVLSHRLAPVAHAHARPGCPIALARLSLPGSRPARRPRRSLIQKHSGVLDANMAYRFLATYPSPNKGFTALEECVVSPSWSSLAGVCRWGL